jgi:hypothetical protein
MEKLGFLKAKFGFIKVVIILLLLECIDNDRNYRYFIVSAILQRLWLYMLECVVLSTSVVPFISPCDRDKFCIDISDSYGSVVFKLIVPQWLSKSCGCMFIGLIS